jgi:hypothetical protein
MSRISSTLRPASRASQRLDNSLSRWRVSRAAAHRGRGRRRGMAKLEKNVASTKL